MKRRDFVASIGAYSVLVRADQLSPAPYSPAAVEDLRARLDNVGKTGASMADDHTARVDLETDVFIAGGGLAGVCAAIAAARNGAKVVLAQDRSRLGGNSSSEVKMHIVGADGLGTRVGWRESGLIEEFRLDDAVNNPQRSFEMWDLLLYDKVVSEPNIVLLLDSALCQARKSGNRVEEVTVRCDRTEHTYHVGAKVFCDCTGDSRLGLEAGAEMRTGRETRTEYGESFAPEAADGHTLGSSILFTSRLHRMPMPFRAPGWARKITKEQLAIRKPGSWEYGYWWIEWGGDRDIVHDDERIRFELLSIVLGVWDYIKNSGAYPESRDWAIDWIGMIPGRRGSRRILGDHVLTQSDLLSGGRFPDAVAVGGWAMDDHPPQGFDRPDLPPNRALKMDEPYGIPLRSLYSRNVENLMMAGRNISCSHVAFTSTRVMATCAVIGQAMGTASAFCARDGVTPRALAGDPRAVARLQQRLLRNDQTIRGIVNQDPDDLARRATVTASSAEVGAPAASVIDGHHRNAHTRDGAVLHYWAAALDPEAWIQLAWPSAVTLGEIQITFDSGFQRMLMLTANDGHNRKILRQPQPETVRHYTISARSAEDAPWREIVQVRDNHQRVNCHRLASVPAQAIRISVSEANGIRQARIFEVRCYKAVRFDTAAELAR